MKDVAAAAGVSLTTVSDALNDKGRLPEATRRRVREVAERLEYRPNSAARSLARGRAGLIAITVAGSEDAPLSISGFAYFVELLSAASQQAFDRGLALVLAPFDADRLRGLPVDGAIVVDPLRDDPMVRRLVAAGTPVVTAGRDLGAPDTTWVDNDHRAGTRKMLDHLARRGARRVALVTGPPVRSYCHDALEAYAAWCRERGQAPLVEITRDALAEHEGFEAAARLFASGEPPDALYATIDRLALGALLFASASGVDVPGSLLVAAATSSDAARTARPAPLTSLDLHPDRIGRAAVDLLVERLGAPGAAPAHRIVPTQVVPRASTGAGARRG